MAQHVPKSILTHSQRVLYKKAYRLIESKHDARINFRLEAVVLRHRFDETRKEDDWRKLAAMLEEGEHEVWAEQHPQPFYFKNDPGGILYNRYCEPYDFVLDHWHPWEKVKYMDYFEQREKRKQEYDKYYEDVISKKGFRLIEPIEFPAPSK